MINNMLLIVVSESNDNDYDDNDDDDDDDDDNKLVQGQTSHTRGNPSALFTESFTVYRCVLNRRRF